MRRLFLAIVLSLVFLGINAIPASAAGEVKLKLANPLPATSPLGWAGTGKPWFEAVKQRTGGKFDLVEYHGGALISGAVEMLKGVGSGIADIGMIVYAYHPSQIRMGLLHGIMLPNLKISGHEAVLISRVLIEEIPTYEEDLRKNNLVNLFQITGFNYHLFSNKPVQNLGDFRNLKVRSYGTIIPKILRAVDAVPVSTSYSEALDALHKGVLDGTLANPVDVVSLRWYEAAPNFTRLGEKGLGTAVSSGLTYNINLKTWNRIPTDMKRIMLEEARRIEFDWGRRIETVLGPAAIEELKQKGLKLYHLSENEMDEWGERCPDLLGEVAEQLNSVGAAGTETIKRFMELKAMSYSELKALWEKSWDKKIASIK
jgi:TRAP-type C4-dicarboxylate transport system substrate-binding protein